ncbi:endonuclease domain-containing protein [Candidatus Saccharibacteria bacterium]|nr:endonuclease domain-containing protein [Candidatus Saccharibacteria bacterium]
MKPKYKQFIFEDYSFDTKANIATLKYSFDGELKFEERIIWDNLDPAGYDQAAFDRVLFGLWIMAGISYYKAYLAPEIVVKKGGLNSAQKAFFDDVYLYGLSQFLYTNQLDPAVVAKFPAGSDHASPAPSLDLKGSLLAVGGGKDSIVAAELLDKLGEDYFTWVVYHHDRFKPLLDKIGKPSFGINRQIDPKLKEVNEQDAYNGHVPVTAIIGFMGAVLAILTGKKSLVWAVESSTDEPNTTWKDLPVNHQYSKSSMFEVIMDKYLKDNVAANMDFYSVLRPLSELRIAEIFCRDYFDKYKGLFSSCNGNFYLDKKDKLSWCGQCPKCAFVYTIFSPFLKKAELMEIFNGRDLFADNNLRGTFEQMLGLDGIKPLECVGEIAEVRTAMQIAKDSGDYPELARFVFPRPDYDYKKWHRSYMPDQIESRLKELLGSA